MLRGFWKLAWVEAKVFIREPMGVIGTVVIPVLIFILVGRSLGDGGGSGEGRSIVGQELPIFASLFIAIGAVLSLVAIISIYREGGILKRLRATPLRPLTILSAHVFVKLLFTALTLFLFILAGRRFYPVELEMHVPGFVAALLLTSVMVFSIGFVIASVVPTARFAQPIGTVILYPLLAVSGIFIPVEQFPPALRVTATILPFSHAVDLLRSAWTGTTLLATVATVSVVIGYTIFFSAIASRVFRWE